MQDSLENPKEEKQGFTVGDKVKNINPECVHYGSRGTVIGVSYLPNEMGKVVTYEASNSGDNWTIGQPITRLKYNYNMTTPT